MFGLTGEQTQGILHDLGNRKQNTGDLNDDIIFAGNFIAHVSRLAFHPETWTLWTPHHFADPKGRFDLFKYYHHNRASNNKNEFLFCNNINLVLKPLWKCSWKMQDSSLLSVVLFQMQQCVLADSQVSDFGALDHQKRVLNLNPAMWSGCNTLFLCQIFPWFNSFLFSDVIKSKQGSGKKQSSNSVWINKQTIICLWWRVEHDSG